MEKFSEQLLFPNRSAFHVIYFHCSRSLAKKFCNCITTITDVDPVCIPWFCSEESPSYVISSAKEGTKNMNHVPSYDAHGARTYRSGGRGRANAVQIKTTVF